MSEPLSWAATKRLVYQRVTNRCEYCFTSQLITGQSMHVDHIVPGAGDSTDNLALACETCNLAKNDAIESLDPETGQFAPIFNPRTQIWTEHFRWIDEGCRISGLTPTGRATIERLKMNQKRIVDARQIWVHAGLHPPK